MIERYSIHAPDTQLIERFQLAETTGYTPRYNAAPSQLLPVITHESPQGFSFFYWGSAPQWAKNKTLAERIVNTRAELIQDKPVLKKSLMRSRCIIPADGFYVWKRVGKKTSIPWRFILKSKKIASFAGLWEEYEDSEGQAHHTFTIITVSANESVSPVTDRMPVLFSRKEEERWLNKETTAEALIDLLKPAPANELEGFTVSPGINSPQAESPLLILPTPATDQFGNLTLFD
ncbi:MAG: SOS response-associated peptidase [Cyclobacteriaceae bacterium]|nr:SOS response-associated peptidase [Cyclobacteriaceae bacterium]